MDVIVPVLGRPQKPGPYATSLWASVDPARVRLTVVGEASDRKTVQAWRRVVRAQDQVLLIPTRPGTFARKVNYAYRHTKAPWLLLTGDDVEFHAGWLDAALEVADSKGAMVVGTNDQGLDRKGLVAPHPLISRSYVKQRGASWDGPGLVCHEGYHHAGVDHEIALVARSRGVWAYATQSVIEHHHFLGKKASMDATYRKGMSKARQDVQLLKRRKRDRAPNLPLV